MNAAPRTAAEPPVQARGLRVRRGAREVLRGVDLAVSAGERVVVLGANGSGKSTLLRVLAGLDAADAGEVHARGAGLVLQQGGLFPHLSALGNLALALRVRREPRAEAIAREALAGVGIARHDAMPHELSGGEQQRVAIARALALSPRVLLLDEPTSALDPDATREVERTLRALSDRGIASLVVTHDLPFAAAVATRTLRLHDGLLAAQ
ncbi:MAG: amino acid ABC transporter ATP-binding protein [Planctomycetota bacterium]